MSDLISRQAAIDAVRQYAHYDDFDVSVVEEDLAIIALKDLPSVQEKQWIPVKTRPMSEEEREIYHECFDTSDPDAVIFESPMPFDGQEVWVCSKYGRVFHDTCIEDEGIGLEENGDWLDIVAWMPFERPEPYKGEEKG